MSDFLAANELALRLFSALLVFCAMAAWEAAAPFRQAEFGRKTRWPNNLGIIVLDAVILRLILPIGLVGAAAVVEAHGWGLLNLVSAPPWLAFLVALILLDVAIYLQHVAFHAVPALWRLHRMHHADPHFDVTTGLRFHPLEILLSTLYKLAVIAALGAPAAAVLVFEIVLNGTALFNHGNVGLPARLDRVLRWIIVTPNMHRIHHSVRPEETNSNFGFNLPWWDRLFGTYRRRAVVDERVMTIGLDRFRTLRDQRIDRMLIQPFLGAATVYPINRTAPEPSPNAEPAPANSEDESDGLETRLSRL